MGLITSLIISTLTIALTAYLLPGVTVESLVMAAAVAIVLGFINITLKPVLKLFTLPINIGTLGLFSVVINALMILLADKLVSGFSVDGFFTAILFSLVLGVINTVVGWVRK